MTRAKISQYSATAGDNTDVNGVDIAEGCPPSSMNNMGREIMAALKRFQVGSDGDGVTVGGSLVVSGSTTANTFSATNVTASGNLTFTGTGNRITGDMSNATVANRVAFQTSTTNGQTNVIAIPNGTNLVSRFQGYTGSTANESFISVGVSGSAGLAQISSDIIGTGTYLPMAFYTGGSERMRIDTSGNLLVGQTSAIPTNGAVGVGMAGGANAGSLRGQGGAGYNFAIWYNSSNSAVIGSIANSGGTATAYNTSSDYRLKENIAPMTGALATIAQLNPVTYTWKVDGSAGQGFIAHELQEVVPDCVTGEKDAVNEDGSIKPQGVDTSFLVATLTAAIQELKAELDTVKAELATLKGQA